MINFSTWKIPIVLIALIALFIVILSFAGGSGGGDTSYTEDALDALLASAQESFTTDPFAPLNSSDGGRANNSWLEGSTDDPALGPEDAPIVIVEFSDFQCPFCRTSFPTVREFVSKHKEEVRYVYRDFPVDDIHPDARLAAEAGACAHEQEKFFPFHDRLFQNQADLSLEALSRYAQQSGLDIEEFQHCLEEGRYSDEVEEDKSLGVELGVRGTPTWFINGYKIEGVMTEELWERIIDSL